MDLSYANLIWVTTGLDYKFRVVLGYLKIVGDHGSIEWVANPLEATEFYDIQKISHTIATAQYFKPEGATTIMSGRVEQALSQHTLGNENDR